MARARSSAAPDSARIRWSQCSEDGTATRLRPDIMNWKSAIWPVTSCSATRSTRSLKIALPRSHTWLSKSQLWVTRIFSVRVSGRPNLRRARGRRAGLGAYGGRTAGPAIGASLLAGNTAPPAPPGAEASWKTNTTHTAPRLSAGHLERGAATNRRLVAEHVVAQLVGDHRVPVPGEQHRRAHGDHPTPVGAADAGHRVADEHVDRAQAVCPAGGVDQRVNLGQARLLGRSERGAPGHGQARGEREGGDEAHSYDLANRAAAKQAPTVA